MPPEFDVGSACQQLSRAAGRWRNTSVTEKAELARRTAQSVGGESDAWVRAAVAMKSLGPDGRDLCTDHLRSVLWAEECATGPIATLRLLFITAQGLQSIDRTGVPEVSVRPRMTHRQNEIVESPFGSPSTFVAVDVLPECRLYDSTIFRGHQATVRCANPGSVGSIHEALARGVSARNECSGSCCCSWQVNVTGLAAACCEPNL